MKEERNFRIHMAAACYSSALGIYMDLDRTQWAVLLLLQSLILSLELVNTAVEAEVDLCCPQQSFLAARAKDAVLIGVGSRIEIWSKERWEETSEYDDMEDIAEHMSELGLMI